MTGDVFRCLAPLLEMGTPALEVGKVGAPRFHCPIPRSHLSFSLSLIECSWEVGLVTECIFAGFLNLKHQFSAVIRLWLVSGRDVGAPVGLEIAVSMCKARESLSTVCEPLACAIFVLSKIYHAKSIRCFNLV